MSRPEWFPFFARDFLVKTAALSTTAVGAYTRMLCHARENSDDLCTVPADARRLARIVALSPKAWSRIEPEVLPFWIPLDSNRAPLAPVGSSHSIPPGAVYLLNPRLLEIAEDQRQRGVLQADKARAAALARWSADHARSMLGASPEHRPSTHKNKDIGQKTEATPNTLFSERGSAETDFAREWVSERFPAFWVAYPRREAKQDALRSWKRLGEQARWSVELFDLIMGGLARWQASDQWQRGIIPLPASWLNKRRWEDETTGGRAAAATSSGRAALATFLNNDGGHDGQQ